MSSDVKTTAQYWSKHTARFSGRNSGLFWYEAGPEIQTNINRRISGSSDIDWIAYTLDKYFSGILPLTRCLSLGCGSGHLERRLAHLGTFQHCDAYDVAQGSIQEAKKLAEDEGLNNITYYVADINKIELTDSHYDSVWVHSAMHHFEALEHVCQQVSQSLKPEGLLILNEYIGPSRFQFPSRQKEVTNLCFHLLPARYRIFMQEQTTIELERTPFKQGARWFISRLIDKLRDGDLIGAIRRRLHAHRTRASGQSNEKTEVLFPSSRDVIAADTSEAIRSGEIIQVLQLYFDIVEQKDWGGNMLQFLLAGIAGNFSVEDQQSQALLKMLINVEDTLLQCGEFESDFAYIVARPRAM